ncbi:MAG TPA: trigger factor [Chloroflexi bacterium]|nr:trigger factor [Chloroflexota bacterium]
MERTESTSDLQITTEPVEPRQVRLTIDVPEGRVREEMRRVARTIARQVSIPGFRKGRAPYHVIAQRLGEDFLRKEAAENLIEPVFKEAVEREGIEPAAPASLEEMKAEPLQYTFTVPLTPEVDLGDYRSLRIKPRTVRVTKKEVEEALERLREEHAVLEPREGRPVQPGDVVSFSVEGRTDRGEIFLKDDDAETLVDLENEWPLPGFYEALVGMKPGEEKTFRLKVPEDSAFDFEEAEFTVRLKQVFERLLPGVDDDLARTAGFDDLDSLRKHLKEQIRQRKQREADEEYFEQAMQALLDGAKVVYPPQVLEEEIDEMVEDLAQRVQRDLRMGLEDYLKAIGKTEEEVREEIRPRAEERLRTALVLNRFVEAEGLEVTDEEVDARVAEIQKTVEEEGRKWTPSEAERRRIRNSLLQEKIVDRLTAIARGEVDSKEKAE